MADTTLPTHASTIIIVRRDSGNGFEVLLTRRPTQMQVLAGYVVFPGGRVEATDWSEKMIARCRGLSLGDAQNILVGPRPAEICMGYWVTAVRELFEEAGIHFFVSEHGVAGRQLSARSIRRVAELRPAVAAGWITLSDLLESEGLFCDLSRLIYLFHRITPEKHKNRFDTRFFLAALPAGQTPLPSSEEVAESLWLMPRIALGLAESGKLPMMPPTLIALRALADIGTWHGLCSVYALDK